MIQRMIGAALLRSATYEEVEADKSVTKQALLVVVLVSVATGIGAAEVGGVSGIIGGVIGGLLAWALWAWITYFVGTRLFPTPQTEADWGQLARTLGFAQSPGILRVLGVIPGLAAPVFLVVDIWVLIACVIAIRQALDYTSTWRAVGVAVVGFIPYALLMTLLSLVAGG